jgi:dihydroorotate dehydrogenase electron transfer subunit
MPTPAYADNAWHGPVTVQENVRLARDTYRLRFACPEIARRVLPGQFVMLRLANCNDPLLGRALAVYDVIPSPTGRGTQRVPGGESALGEGQGGIAVANGRPHFLDIVYLVVGKMTRLLAEFSAGAQLEAWGPLGNGFPPTPTEHLVMVAGGIGQTPFLMLAREYLGLAAYGAPPRAVPRAKKITFCYGVRTCDHLAGIDDFRSLGVGLELSTDDGSFGHRGFVTDLIGPVVEKSPWPCRIVCCGPEVMMEATARIAQQLGVPCQVSLESPMACGIGACFSCVKKIRDATGGWDYRRTCVEGPVFEAGDVQF